MNILTIFKQNKLNTFKQLFMNTFRNKLLNILHMFGPVFLNKTRRELMTIEIQNSTTHEDFLNLYAIRPCGAPKLQHITPFPIKYVNNQCNVKLHIFSCDCIACFLNRARAMKHGDFNCNLLILSKFPIQFNPLIPQPFINHK